MRALVVDDHPLIQEAVGSILRRIEADAEIVVAGDCEAGLDLALQGAEPDIVLLDLNLPGLSGIAALKQWRKQFPAVPVAILSASAEPTTVLAAIGAGAAGFVPKSSTNDVMESALRLVLAGGKYLPPEVLARTDRKPRRSREQAQLTKETLGLTGRQAEVLRLIAKGASNKLICRELGLAERTVKAHVTAVFRALKVSSRTQAAIEAANLGIGSAASTRDRARDA